MADTVNKRKIMIAMDGSEYSEGALKCKYYFRSTCSFFFSSGRGLNVDRYLRGVVLLLLG